LSAAFLADKLEEIQSRYPRTHGASSNHPAFGAVAQLGERLVRNEEVSGSIPLSSTIESIHCGIELETVAAFCRTSFFGPVSLCLFPIRKQSSRSRSSSAGLQHFLPDQIKLEMK
jgi:hypothetical protein